MQDKKNKIILWSYLGLMVLFILLVNFSGEEKAHTPEVTATTEAQVQVATHTEAAPKTEMPPAIDEKEAEPHQNPTGDTPGTEPSTSHTVTQTSHALCPTPLKANPLRMKPLHF